MTGRRAPLKVAWKTAIRNRKRTIFLVLLVAVPVALGVVVAGITRASTFTPTERTQLQMGAADIQMQPQGGEEVVSWVYENTAEFDPEARLTDFRRTRVVLEDFESGLATDLDVENPLTRGMLVLLEGRTPRSSGEAAVSPRVAENMDVGIGDRVEFDRLDVGELEIVGMVSEPIAQSDETVLLWPGALEETVEFSTVLVGTEDADAVWSQLMERWESSGQQEFWPEPAVDPKPEELEFLDDQVYVFLTETEIEELVELARSDPENGVVDVRDRAFEMYREDRGPAASVNLHGDTRERFMSQGGVEGNPAVVSTAASTILLIEVAFITGAAFAAGTRRRLREIGLLSAGGASRKHVRTTVVGEGLTIGLVGSALGVLLGIGVLFFGRPVLDDFVTKLITGVGVSPSDIAGPVLVAVLAVLLAVWIPARTASKIPTTTALQGRMPASPPRRWIVPVGLAAAAVGLLLIAVAIVSTSNFSGAIVGAGGVMVVGGVAMLASPILAGMSKLADHVPAIGRLVLRDSGRHRTRSSVAVAAIMVILLAPAIFLTMAETTRHQELLSGLPEPSNQLLVQGTFGEGGSIAPLEDETIESVAAIVPTQEVARFDVLNIRTRTQEQMEIDASQDEMRSTINMSSEENAVAVAGDDLVAALDDDRLTDAIGTGRIVVLGVQHEDTTVSIDHDQLPAVELPIPVVRDGMPRILIPPAMVNQYDNVETRQVALLILDRPMTDEERSELHATLDVLTSGGFEHMGAATVYTILAGVALLAVLLVIALVTAVSAAEVDQDLSTIVAVGVAGSFRKRFLGLLTGYQTLIGALLAVPLGLALIKAFTSAVNAFYLGTFGHLNSSTMFIPWSQLVALIALTPLVVGALTWISVRSARVKPLRRVT
ncbi:MAG: ABC transporter permease [Actinomycetota bacterium]